MKKLGLVLVLLSSLLLTGCMQDYQLSEKSTNVAAEYMAGVLLAQDGNYKPRLIATDKLKKHQEDLASKETNAKKEPTPTPQENDKKHKDEIKVLSKDVTLSEVIGTDNFEINYLGYKLHSVYPEDETNTYFSLTPREGNQLLVVSFSMENITKKDKKIDLKKAGVAYQLDINVGTIYKPLFTLLENDLRYIDMTIGAGNKETVLLIFEVSKDIAMKDINLIISRDSKTKIIDIK